MKETRSRSIKALLVDDDDAETKLLGAIFTKNGFDFKVARTGTAALWILGGEQFDVMIFDVGLPDEDGIDLARQARELRPEMPILLLTDYKHEPRTREAAVLLVADYVLKPIAIDEVRSRIDELLRFSEYPPLPAGRALKPISGAGHKGDERDQVGTNGNQDDKPLSTELDGTREMDSTLDLRVMLVAPDRSLRRRIASTLSDMGCLVVTYASIEQACTVVRDVEPDIVIASSHYLAQWNPQFFSRDPQVRPGLIAILEEPGEATRRAALDVGAHDVLAPPFEKPEIARVLRLVLEAILQGRTAAANQRRRRRR